MKHQNDNNNNHRNNFVITTTTHDGIENVTFNANIIEKYNDLVLNDVLLMFYKTFGSNIQNDFHIAA